GWGAGGGAVGAVRGGRATAARGGPFVGRDDEPPAGHLVADELRPGAFPLRHPPHLPGDHALPGRFELCHVALPSAGITRVRFEGSAGSPCFLSRLERGGSPSVVSSCLRPLPRGRVRSREPRRDPSYHSPALPLVGRRPHL